MSDAPSKIKEKPPGASLHALKTPLNQIIGYAELLEEEAREKGSEPFVTTLQKIQAAAWRLSGLLGADSESPGPEARGAERILRETAELPGSLEHLLVVDDNEANRDMLSRRLASRGYRVSVADSGQKALDLIAEERFDLVLLDIMMPEMSGTTALKRLRALHSRAELPIIMATAKDQSQDIVESLGLGANDYVTKPIDFPVLLARVEAHLSLKRALAEIQRLMIGLELRNEFIRRIFGRYSSDEVVSGLLESAQGLELGGEERHVTILMCDLRGFSALETAYPPGMIVKILNNYLGAMVEIVAKHQGTIDEFMGDAIFVVFGAPVDRPDDARRACACAIEMQRALLSVNDWHLLEELPELKMGIGVDTGRVVVGNIGSEKRAKFGVIGNHVNLTARIESLAQAGQVLISESTLRAAGGEIEVGRQFQVKAKGFREQITVHELKAVGGEYNLMLPERSETVLALPKEVPVHYAVLKDGEEKERRLGSLVGLADGAAELRLEAPVEPPTLLALQFLSSTGRDVPGEVHARVQESGAGGGLTLVRFTSVPASIHRFFEDLLPRPEN
jgi:class 3 adenylate cyclase/AmiR/NasT family two-component response regulator